MQISVALDGNRRRDLEFFSGDDTTISVGVYANDGDETPIFVSDLALLYDGSSLTPGGSSFIAGFGQRERYTITGYIGGHRTTIAYGLLIRKWDESRVPRSGMYEPLFVRNQINGGTAGSYFEGPGLDGGDSGYTPSSDPDGYAEDYAEDYS